MAETEIPQKIDDRPKEIYLNRHIRLPLCAACDVNPQAWKDLGIELMPDAEEELSAISAEHPNSLVKRCSSLFQLWLQRESNASWKQLLDALKKINQNHLATQIEGMLASSVDTATHTESAAPVMPVEGNHIIDTATHTESATPVIPVEGNHFVDTATHSESVAPVMPVEGRSSVSDDESVSISDLFKEHTTIANAYTILFTQLYNVLKCCDISALKKAVFRQARTPDGVELEKYLVRKIKAANSPSELLDTLEKSPSCSWLDTRLIEVLAYSSESVTAVELIKAYQKFLFPKKLLDVLPKQRKLLEAKTIYVTEVTTKIKKNPNEVTVGDFIEYQWRIEDVILDLARGMLNVQHVSEGCLEVNYLMPVHYSFNAYKMALHNRYKFYTLNLIYIEVGDYPLICDPWLCDLEHPVKQQPLQIYHVLQDKMPLAEYQQETLQQDSDLKVLYTLHSKRTVKLGFVDDSVIFNKLQECYSTKLSGFINPFQHVKHINPSEVQKEFYYLSGHVIELLKCCHPELLKKWCENLMASGMHKINLLSSYSLYKLRKLKTSSAIIKMMSIFWSWSNHSILKSLAEFSEIAAALLEDFDSRLYLNSLITKYPIRLAAPSMIPHNNSSFTVLTVKCNRKLQVTLQEVYDIQSMIIEKFEITQHALQLLAVQSSPLILQWMISKYIVTVIYKNVRKYHDYFATKGITEILIHPNIKHSIDGDVNEKPILLDELGRTPLHEAIYRRDDKTVEMLITAGTDVNFVNKDGDTPLYEAIYQRNDKIVEILITAGAEVNFVNKHGNTPLHEAARWGNDKIVEVLTTAGADVNFVDKFGDTPLYEAIYRGADKIVEILITAGADVNFVDENGDTPLHIVMYRDDDKIVKILITAGADVNIVNKISWTYLHTYPYMIRKTDRRIQGAALQIGKRDCKYILTFSSKNYKMAWSSL